jgi:hypothetical protein
MSPSPYPLRPSSCRRRDLAGAGGERQRLPDGGQMVGVVLSIAEVANAGQRFIAVDPSSISIRYTEGEKTWKATLNARFDQLKGAPVFRYEGKWTR